VVRGDESGMTLVEVVVAMALLAGSVFAAVSVFDSTARASARMTERERALALAEEVVEEMVAAPYDAVGLDPAADGYVDTFEGHATVQVQPSDFGPRETRTVGAVTYTIVRHITWGEVRQPDGTSVPGSWKRLTVEVRWDPGRTVRLDSGVAPDRQARTCAQRWVEPDTFLTGVVNSYFPASGTIDPGGTAVPLGPPRDPTAPPIEAGDLVLVMQMTGPAAGTYEYAMATSRVQGGWIALTGRGPNAGLLNRYSDDEGAWQVVRVPTYKAATIGPGFAAEAWDGSTGGVVALDVDGTLTFDTIVDLSAQGLSEATPDGFVPDPSRLLPGGGFIKQHGGALFMARAGVLAGETLIRADGTTAVEGSDGGTVVIAAERGGLEGLEIEARGGASVGPGGHLLLSGDPARTDVSGGSGGGEAGTVRTDLNLSELVGVGLGVGCHPVLEVQVATETPEAKPGGSVTYRLSVRNRLDRGDVSEVQILSGLGRWFTYGATVGIELSGGAGRTTVHDPTPGAPLGWWGTFSIPPGGVVTIVFSALVAPDAEPGVYDLEAVALYESVAGAGAGTYAGGFSTDDDVVIP
jgi:type II secretory pathway pseudopilin PulG